MNNNVTRWPNGFTNSVLGTILGDLKFGNPATYHYLFDDYDVFTAGNWVNTKVGASSAPAIGAGDNGLLVATNTGASGDLNSLQWAGGTGAVSPTFLFDSTRDFIVAARLKLDDALNGAFLVGLAIADTSPIASLPASWFGVYKAAAGRTPQGYSAKASVSANTSQTTGSLVDDTFADVGMVYSAAEGLARLFVNAASYQLAMPSTIQPGVLLAPTLAVQNGTAAARTMTVDWSLFAKARATG